MNKILTIIIPSYNMERYLTQCLSSLNIEDLDSVEILVINDGSKDRTLDIAKEFRNKFPASIRVIDKENGNYGSCINRGLEEATGKYIKVLDADDSFDTGVFSRFVDFLKSTNADLVISDYAIVNEEGITTKKIIFHQPHGNTNTFEFRDCLKEISQEKFQMHAVTYKTSILKDIDYHQTEGISYTDQEWMFAPMENINTISFFHGILYKYLVGREGQTVDITVSTRAVKQTIAVVNSMLMTYANREISLDNIKKSYLYSRLWQKIPSIYRICLLKSPSLDNDKIVEVFDDKLKRFNIAIYERMNKENLKGFPFYYVSYWRKKKNSNLNMPLLKITRSLVKFAIK